MFKVKCFDVVKMEYSRLPELPNEIWIAIFKAVDFATLLDLSLVCKHWNRLIFTHLANRIVLILGPELRQCPPRGHGMVPERSYKHLRLYSFKLDSPAHLFEIVLRLAPHLDSLTLDLAVLECQDLAQLLVRCTRISELSLTAWYFVCDETCHSLEPAVLSNVRSFGFDVHQFVSTPHLLPLSAQNMPNVQRLKIGQYRAPLDAMCVGLVARLKVLEVTVEWEAWNDFLSLRLPALEELNLTFVQRQNVPFNGIAYPVPAAFQSFLRGCESLKTASLFMFLNQELTNAILAGLPRVEVLSLKSMATNFSVGLSFNGLERMTSLKTLSVQSRVLIPDDYPVVPSVEKLELCVWNDEDTIRVLRNFPNVKSLALIGNLPQSINGSVPLLQELSVSIAEISPRLISHVQQLGALKKVTISSDYLDTANFRLLRNLMILPAMSCLSVSTQSIIHPTIASTVAGANHSCQLVLNGRLVQSTIPTPRRSGRKRKQSAAVSTPR